jgi:hypothetical protein
MVPEPNSSEIEIAIDQIPVELILAGKKIQSLINSIWNKEEHP